MRPGTIAKCAGLSGLLAICRAPIEERAGVSQMVRGGNRQRNEHERLDDGLASPIGVIELFRKRAGLGPIAGHQSIERQIAKGIGWPGLIANARSQSAMASR